MRIQFSLATCLAVAATTVALAAPAAADTTRIAAGSDPVAAIDDLRTTPERGTIDDLRVIPDDGHRWLADLQEQGCLRVPAESRQDPRRHVRGRQRLRDLHLGSPPPSTKP